MFSSNRIKISFCSSSVSKKVTQPNPEFKEEQCKGIWSSLNLAVITGEAKSAIKYTVTTNVIY
jgi:hypothetical protein